MTMITRSHAGFTPHRIQPVNWLVRAYRVWQQRQALRDLDDRLLGDIGISRGDAETEAGRRFYDLPDQRAG